MPQTWIKGHLQDDNTLTFESGQYLGIDGNHVNYLCTGEHYTQYDADWDITDHCFRLSDGVTFSYNPETKSFAVTNEDDAFILNSSTEEIYYTQAIWNMDFKLQAPVSDLHPQAPSLESCQMGERVYYITFMTNPMNAAGDRLDENGIGFKVYYNGEPYTFTAEQTGAEEMNTIPWGFFGNVCYLDSYDGFSYLEWPVGDNDFDLEISAVNTVDGTEYESPRLTLLKNSGIVAARASGEIKQTYYVDPMGRILSSPEKGVYIRVDVMTDGNTRKIKTIK